MSLLSNDEIKDKIGNLNDWKLVENSIEKEYELDSFTYAMGFVTKIGIQAEKMDHHPDIFIHSWNKVRITLTTHCEGGLTDNDLKLAEIIDNL
ncbi:MAG: 4a-hydroxytetrahydrobiopterin dehydratase [Melioribacteraceae bacterium]|nr:4a-hydroxytetrahydrobiopterin dehydratase [Melioribacteraceae bacterium]MCF8352847.1 4a-hydroxytetrahydrobiopterin dehydratase [Melioribacteraceae bacterium]MCF8417364.1 4a-hydroxytetrahydrobiopterin dehydratase [Melioribacteraceae bacterium]